MYIFTAFEGFSPKPVKVGLEHTFERKVPMRKFEGGIGIKVVISVGIVVPPHPVAVPGWPGTQGDPIGDNHHPSIEVKA